MNETMSDHLRRLNDRAQVRKTQWRQWEECQREVRTLAEEERALLATLAQAPGWRVFADLLRRRANPLQLLTVPGHDGEARAYWVRMGQIQEAMTMLQLVETSRTPQEP